MFFITIHLKTSHIEWMPSPSGQTVILTGNNFNNNGHLLLDDVSVWEACITAVINSRVVEQDVREVQISVNSHGYPAVRPHGLHGGGSRLDGPVERSRIRAWNKTRCKKTSTGEAFQQLLNRLGDWHVIKMSPCLGIIRLHWKMCCYGGTLTAGHPVGFRFGRAWWRVTGQDQRQASADRQWLQNVPRPHRSSYKR